jgi:hypothetical protein
MGFILTGQDPMQSAGGFDFNQAFIEAKLEVVPAEGMVSSCFQVPQHFITYLSHIFQAQGITIHRLIIQSGSDIVYPALA